MNLQAKKRMVVITCETMTHLPLKDLRNAKRMYISIESSAGCWERIYPLQSQANVIQVAKPNPKGSISKIEKTKKGAA